MTEFENQNETTETPKKTVKIELTGNNLLCLRQLCAQLNHEDSLRERDKEQATLLLALRVFHKIAIGIYGHEQFIPANAEQIMNQLENNNQAQCEQAIEAAIEEYKAEAALAKSGLDGGLN